MEHPEKQPVLSMKTLLPLAMVVVLCGACIALGQFLGTVSNHEVRITQNSNRLDSEIKRIEDKMNSEVQNLKNDIQNLNSKIDTNFKELKNNIENINIILAKFAAKLQVDVRDNLPKAQQNPLSYDTSNII